jgi:hypothetical protein
MSTANDATPRILIVSNRAPVTVQIAGGEWSLHRSAGGLAASLPVADDRLSLKRQVVALTGSAQGQAPQANERNPEHFPRRTALSAYSGPVARSLHWR